MKLKKLISALLILSMLIIPLPSAAEELPSVEGIEVKIPEGYKVDFGLYQGEFHGEKSNLAMITLDDAQGKSHYAFVDRAGNVTLFEDFYPDFYHHHAGMGHFYNGIAAVFGYSNEERKWKVGYIDEQCNEIVPEIYDAISNPLASNTPLSGNFYDDYTYIFKDIKTLDYPTNREVTGRYAKMDRNGNIIGEWSDEVNLFSYDSWGKSWLGYKEYPLAQQLMLAAKTHSIKIEQTGPWSTVYKNISITDTSLHFEDGSDAVVLNTTDGLIIADLDQFRTQNKSQLKIVDWRPLDNAHCIKVSLRNNNFKIDTSNYAVVFFDDHSSAQDYHKCTQTSSYNCNIGEVHFLDSVTLLPGENKYIEFSTQWHGDYVLNNKIKVIVLKFESETEKLNFKESIPFYTGHHDKEINYELKRFEGEKWFKDTFNLSIDERWRTYEK